MKGKLFPPVVCNVITIVAMLLALYQMVVVATSTRTTEGILLLERLVEEGAVEDATIASDFASEREQRMRGGYVLIATIVVAILANVGANYLGRERHHENNARIRELEGEIRGLQGK